MKILKQWLSKEEFERFIAGTWTPDSHTHTRSEITDFWNTAFWASIPDKPSTFTPSAHASSHHSGGGDLLDHGSIPGLGNDDHTQYHNDARGDARYYTQGQVDTKLALQDTLAEMDDVFIVSPEHGEFLVFDSEIPPYGKWVCATGFLDHGALSGLEDDDHSQYYNAARHTKAVHDALNIDADTLDSHDTAYFAVAGHAHDDRYYTESEVDTKLALQDTLAEMGDTLIVSPEDGELLIWDADSPPSGKWICSLPFPTDHGALSGLGDDDHTQYHTDARGDARYFRETEFLIITAGPGDEGKPIKLNAAGLVDNTMLVACDADKLDGEHGSHYSVVGHTHDTRYYTESEVDTKLALQDTLAEMGDVKIISPEDGEFLVYDTEANGGKWVASSELPGHTHDDRYYTKTELNNGQLDNIYFGEDEFLVSSAGPGDSGKPIKLNAAGQVDATMIPGGGQDELVKVGAAGGSDYLNPNYFQRDVVDHVRIKLNTLLTGVDADKVDGLHAASFALTTRALDTFGATTDITTLNATTTKHGLLMKLGGGTTNFLRADGTWVAPPSGVTDHGALSGLGDDDHSQYLLASGARMLSADWDAGFYQIRSLKFQSDVSTGTAPFLISSTTKCTNLNADRVDGYHASQVAGNNTVVVRSSAGYIFCNYLNCTSGETSSNPTHYIVETGNDSYLRQMTPAIFISNLRADGLMGVVGGTFTGAIYVPDHMGTPAHAQVTNCCYGTGSPPAPNTTTIGTLFIRYTA